MLEKDTHNLLWALAVFLIGGMVIFGIEAFFPNAFADIQNKITNPWSETSSQTSEKTIYTSTSFSWDNNGDDPSNYIYTQDSSIKDKTYWIAPEKLPDGTDHLKMVQHVKSDQTAPILSHYGMLQLTWEVIPGTYDSANGTFHGNEYQTDDIYTYVYPHAEDSVMDSDATISVNDGDYILVDFTPQAYYDNQNNIPTITYQDFASAFSLNYVDVVCYDKDGNIIKTIHVYPKASGTSDVHQDYNG